MWRVHSIHHPRSPLCLSRSSLTLPTTSPVLHVTLNCLICVSWPTLSCSVRHSVTSCLFLSSFHLLSHQYKQSSWPQSVSEIFRPIYHRLSAKLVPSLANRVYLLVSATDPFLDRSRYFFFQVSPQLYSRGWMVPVTDPLPLRKSGSAGNRTQTSESVARNRDN
jgi:hypothetical protein